MAGFCAAVPAAQNGLITLNGGTYEGCDIDACVKSEGATIRHSRIRCHASVGVISGPGTYEFNELIGLDAIIEAENKYEPGRDGGKNRN